MNFMECESPRKLRGGYYTDADIAAFLTAWALEARPQHILEPSCGDGVFLDAIAQLAGDLKPKVAALELDAGEARKARARVRGRDHIHVHGGNFLDWYLRRPAHRSEFDAVLGNPPFVRYQYLGAGQQALAQQIFERHALPFTKHTNLWVPFVIASLALLKPGGRLAMVVPAELLHVLHARSLRDFLLDQCARVLLIDPHEIWFNDTLQGVILLLAQKRAPADTAAASLAIQPIAGRRELSRPAAALFARADFFSASVLDGSKWMLGLLTSRERSLLAALSESSHIRRFADVASVDVGIVTGANQFFLVPDAVVDAYGLQAWAQPMFGRSDHVRGVIYDADSHAENRRLGLRANFLAFGATPWRDMPRGARRYIAAGESEGLPRRYKCRIRSPWYNVPSVYVAPVGMLKRCHHFPRLVLNTARAFTTDTAYRIGVKQATPAALVASFVNSLTALSSELEGRHYGGGVLELVPSEIEKLLVPVAAHAAANLSKLDGALRGGVPAEEVLDRQDETILRPLGISAGDAVVLHSAWQRLRARRQRDIKALALSPA